MRSHLSKKQALSASTFGILALLYSAEAMACSVCMGGDANDPNIKGIQYGIFVLIGIIGFIGVVIIKFIFDFKKRAAQHAQ